jgi:hypothetical protein
MDMGVDGASSRFSDRVLRLLEKVEHRCANTRSEREAVHRLRHEGDVRQDIIEPRADGLADDKALDDAPNAWITTTFIDGELASIMRIHVGADETDAIPSLGAFSDVIMPHLRTGRTIVDPTRLVARLEFARRFPELPYIALRPAWLAAEYFEADFVLATILQRQRAFYQHALGYRLWREPRDHQDFNRQVACMALDFSAAKERVEARYPFFRSTWAERDAVFGRWPERRSQAQNFPEGRHRPSPTAS